MRYLIHRRNPMEILSVILISSFRERKAIDGNACDPEISLNDNFYNLIKYTCIFITKSK